jgi:hypothetical protein
MPNFEVRQVGSNIAWINTYLVGIYSQRLRTAAAVR